MLLFFQFNAINAVTFPLQRRFNAVNFYIFPVQRL